MPKLTQWNVRKIGIFTLVVKDLSKNVLTKILFFIYYYQKKCLKVILCHVFMQIFCAHHGTFRNKLVQVLSLSSRTANEFGYYSKKSQHSQQLSWNKWKSSTRLPQWLQWWGEMNLPELLSLSQSSGSCQSGKCGENSLALLEVQTVGEEWHLCVLMGEKEIKSFHRYHQALASHT